MIWLTDSILLCALLTEVVCVCVECLKFLISSFSYVLIPSPEAQKLILQSCIYKTFQAHQSFHSFYSWKEPLNTHSVRIYFLFCDKNGVAIM